MAPLERRGQEKYEAMWDEVRRNGFVRIRVDGKSYNVEEPPAIDHRRKHLVEVVVDRVIVRSNQRTRIADAVEAALDLGRGVMHLAYVDEKKPSRIGAWTVSVCTSLATAAAGASSRSTRIIFRSTARSVGARAAKGLAYSRAPPCPAPPRRPLVVAPRRRGRVARLVGRRLIPPLRRSDCSLCQLFARYAV